MAQYPSRDRIGNALLTLFYLKGGSHHHLQSSDTYGPLADNLRIGEAERCLVQDEYYANGSAALLFPNLVQWARRDLVDAGLIDGSEHGMWRLTPRGVAFAQLLQRIRDQVAAIMKQMIEVRRTTHENESRPNLER